MTPYKQGFYSAIKARLLTRCTETTKHFCISDWKRCVRIICALAYVSDITTREAFLVLI